MKQKLGLYLHVPFCVRKCRYCDFYSSPGGLDERGAYVKGLLVHLEHEARALSHYEVDTVYFGGGTPTLLSGEDFKQLLHVIGECYDLAPNAEITTECNPVSGGAGMAERLLEAGVNRLSIGLQSANENELALLGRPHGREEFLSTYRAARAAGFRNISVDLMFGIPEQTVESLERSLSLLCELSPEHLSVYGLRVEEGTPFYACRESLALPDEDTEAEMAERIAARLFEAGYWHYEVSNFAKPGYHSRHNMRYWLGEEYLGFGPGAHSYLGGVRFETAPDKHAYLAAVARGDFASLRTNATVIGGDEARDEYVMLRMRLFEGVDLADFQHRFGQDFFECYRVPSSLFEGGFLRRTDKGLAFTERGMRVSNAILSDWLNFGE